MKIPDALYRQILRVMPVPCVDLLVCNEAGEVLLVRRAREPARGQWWFPGGRVHHGEVRHEAAVRKLREECGLQASSAEELCVHDVILESGGGPAMHGVTTVFRVDARAGEVRLDEQSSEAAWRTGAAWAEEDLHPFVHGVLSEFAPEPARR